MSQSVPSAVHLTRRGLITFAIVWQGAWMLSDPSLWPTNQSTEFESILILATWVMWICMLALLITWFPGNSQERWLTRVAYANIVLLALSAVAISLISIDPRIDDWITSASIFNLVIGLAGIIIYQPRQWVWVASLFCTELVIFIGFGFNYAGEMTIVSVFLYPLYALAIGIAAATVQRALMKGADEYDVMRDAVVEQQTISQQIHDSERDVSLMQSRVHESVLNTLTAISRGGLPDTVEFQDLIRHKASESAQVLTEIVNLRPVPSQAHWTGLTESVSDLVYELSARGIRVRIVGDTGSNPPEQVEAVVIAAVRESLINILRHSQASEVDVRVNSGNGEKFSVTIIDNGIGFDHDRVGFGLGSILATQLEEVGARATIRSSANQGTTVVIEYAEASRLSRHVRSLTWNFKQPSFGFVAPVILSWVLYSFASILFTWNSYESYVINILAFGVLCGASLWTMWLSRSGGIPWWLVLVGVIAAYVGYQLEYLALGSGRGEPWTEWSSELIVALFFVFAVAGPWWAWILIGISWVYIQGNFPAEFIAPGFAMLMTGAFLGWTIRRNSRRLARSVRDASESASQASIARIQTGIRFERFAALKPQSTIDLLQAIAGGAIGWREEGTKRMCAVHEAYIRNVVMGQNPSSSELRSELADLARERGIVLETIVTDVSESLAGNGEIVDQVKTLIKRLEHFESGRLTISRENGCTIFRLVGQLTQDLTSNLGDLVEVGQYDYEVDPMGTFTFVWQASSGERPLLMN